jgi:hypothetical protein
VGGIAREYFTRLLATYGKTLEWDKAFESKGGGPATGGAYSIEPHVAEKVFDEMAREAKVGVHFNARLAAVKKDGARIGELVADDGTVFRAKMFIDATYEGDLMAKAGVTYTLMREGNAKYGETYNGIYYDAKYQPRINHQKPGPTGRVPGGQGVWDRDLPLDPYVVPGDPASGLLPLINAGEPGTPGEPAPGVQAYCFRLCLSKSAHRIPITKPPDYDPKRYELVARFIEGCLAMGDDIDLRWFSKHDALPNEKWDFNTATFGGNLPGASWGWPEATYARREQIAKEHENYHRGLLHFLATDERVPGKVRVEMKSFGFPRDEFTDNGGWPHQLYIREARRMVSELVMTEHHTFGREVAPKSVSLGSYGTDTHEIRRIVKDGVVTREGKTAGGRDGAGPYPIGFAAIVPKQSECENLFVTFALSASHTAFSSIRMEPVFMCTSHSAATAACLAIDSGIPVQQVDYAQFRARSLADGQVLEWKGAATKAAAAGDGAPAVPSGEAEGAITLGGLPLLFADDSGVARSSGVVRTVHPAHTRREPVLVADRPWEGSRVYIYGSVHLDESSGQLAMWYLGHPDADEKGETAAVPGFRKGKGDVVLYATSRDGLSWEKPALGLHSFQGSAENNIVFDLHSPSVLVDAREPDPSRRYKMLGSLAGKYFAAVSADGLKWRKFPDAKPILLSSDNISLTRDPATGDYLAFHRRPSKVPGRNVSLSRSHDFQTWSEPELVFAPDAQDHAWTKNPDERTEVNNLAVFPHAAGFIGLPTMFRVLGKDRQPSELSRGQSPTDGIIDVQLITSEDGRTWQRTVPRMNVIARGAPGNFDAGTILGVSSTSVDVGEETWVYYTALTTSHGAPVPPKRISIGRAEWRRHGFVSLDAGERGRVETKPLRLAASTLLINADATDGELRVALLDENGGEIPGYAVEDCEPLRADATRWPVRWQSTEGLPADRAVRVVIEFKQARLFSISTGTLPLPEKKKP